MTATVTATVTQRTALGPDQLVRLAVDDFPTMDGFNLATEQDPATTAFCHNGLLDVFASESQDLRGTFVHPNSSEQIPASTSAIFKAMQGVVIVKYLNISQPIRYADESLISWGNEMIAARARWLQSL